MEKPIKIETGKLFTREGKTAEILQEVTSAIPKNTKVYMIGGAARNAVYYEFFKKPLRQRDFDLLVVGNLDSFVKNIRAYGFIYGKIRRKNQVVLKKKMIPRPQSIQDYIVLDIHRTFESNVVSNLKASAAFTINGFAIPLQIYLSPKIVKHIISLPNSIVDIKNKNLKLNLSGYKDHPGNLFACLRFMSLGFKMPNKQEVSMLLEELPKLETRRYKKNVKKALNYVGGEEKARKLLKKLGIKIDVFNENEVKNLKNRESINHKR